MGKERGKLAVLEHLADTFDRQLRMAERAKDESFASAYFEGRSDAFGWAWIPLPQLRFHLQP